MIITAVNTVVAQWDSVSISTDAYCYPASKLGSISRIG